MSLPEKKDRPGQLGNRLQHTMWQEAVNIVLKGIAEAEDVALAANASFGLRLPVYGISERRDRFVVEFLRTHRPGE